VPLAARHRVLMKRVAREPARWAGIRAHLEGDVSILAAAVADKVDYLVTGDKGLLELRKIGGTAIVQAGKLLEKLKK
jgi:predicted nucleic acid-binding protein